MLTSIRIINYLSCQDVFIQDLSQLTALVGRNAAGKTNILHAISDISAFASNLTGSHPPSNSKVTTEFTLIFSQNGEDYRYTYAHPVDFLGFSETLTVVTNHSDVKVFVRDGVVITYADRTYSVGENAPALPTLNALLPSHEISHHITSTLRYFAGFAYYPLESKQTDEVPGMLISQTYYQQWQQNLVVDPTAHDSVNIRLLHLYNTRSADFTELTQILGENGLDVLRTITVSEIHLTHKNLGFYLSFDLKDQTNLVFHELSHGTQRLITLMLAIIYDKSSLMLIEQPEDGIHRRLLNKLINLCQQYAYFSQMIMTTHSALVMDNLQPKAIKLVAMAQGHTQCIGMSQEQLTQVKAFIENEGTLSDFIEVLEDSVE